MVEVFGLSLTIERGLAHQRFEVSERLTLLRRAPGDEA